MPSKDPVKRNEAAQRHRDKQIAVKKAAEDKEKERREYFRINKQKSREKLAAQAAQAATMDPPAAENRQLIPTGSSSANGFASSMNIGRPHPELGAFTGTTLTPSSTFIRRQQQESTPRPFPPGSARKQTPRQQHLLTARRSQFNAHIQRTVAAQEREATESENAYEAIQNLVKMGIGAIEQSTSKRRTMQVSERAELLELGLDFEEAETGMMYHPDDDDNTDTHYYSRIFFLNRPSFQRMFRPYSIDLIPLFLAIKPLYWPTQ